MDSYSDHDLKTGLKVHYSEKVVPLTLVGVPLLCPSQLLVIMFNKHLSSPAFSNFFLCYNAKT